jgi:3'(2'), 5'-bisphosphate nucleotidase
MGSLKDSIPSLLPVVINTAHLAGAAILEVYGTEFTVEHKKDNSPLTMADQRSHDIIMSGLNSIPSPQLPVLSEEGKNIPYEDRQAWQDFWLVDPLDGTKEFIRRNGEFTVNIALIHMGSPVMGVIHLPVKGITYFGAEGLGSYRTELSAGAAWNSIDAILGAAVKLPLVAAHPAPFTVIGSRSHMSGETQQYINSLKEEAGEIEFISAGSSLKFCLIAEGKADQYPRFAPTMEWDTAAGQAIVEQAGGTVLEVSGQQPMHYNKEILLNPWFIAKKSVALSGQSSLCL